MITQTAWTQHFRDVILKKNTQDPDPIGPKLEKSWHLFLTN